jgi:hypothetical protein
VTVREQARRRAQEELSKPEYLDERPGWLERAIVWLLEQFADLRDEATVLTGVGPWWGLVGIIALVAGFVMVVRRRTGRVARGTARESTLFLGGARTAAEHRRAADAHAAAQRWDEAVRERLRAVVRTMEERGLLDPRPGRTALEAAADGGAQLPSCAAGLRQGAELFDEVWYGGRRAGAGDHAALLSLDRQVAAAGAAPLTGAGAAAESTVARS